ncbi:MAG: hypothetical protein H8D78_18275 [Chloroflexi bacterium]|nr:hypothetical protein [Chloroflexota bacterium]
MSELETRYVEELGVLFKDLSKARRPPTRGVKPPSSEEVAERSEELLARNADVTQAWAAKLESDDVLARQVAEIRLLAACTADLALADDLVNLDRGKPRLTSRGRYGPSVSQDLLQLLTMSDEEIVKQALTPKRLRGVTRAAGPAADRMQEAVDTTLDHLLEGTADTGQRAIEGLILMDAALLLEAARIVGGDIAEKLGEGLSRLMQSAVRYILAAYDKVALLLGAEKMAEIREQILGWITDLQEGELFPELVEKLFQTEALKGEVAGWLAASSVSDATLGETRATVEQLDAAFGSKMELADKIISSLALVKLLPPTMTPVGRLVIAAVYLGLAGYVVFTGYDHVDSDRWKLIDRVSGVRQVAQEALT